MRLPEGIIKQTLQVYTFYGLVCRLNQRKKFLGNLKHSNLIIFYINDYLEVEILLSIGKISI